MDSPKSHLQVVPFCSTKMNVRSYHNQIVANEFPQSPLVFFAHAAANEGIA